jgi:hypothetical protein
MNGRMAVEAKAEAKRRDDEKFATTTQWGLEHTFPTGVRASQCGSLWQFPSQI